MGYQRPTEWLFMILDIFNEVHDFRDEWPKFQFLHEHVEIQFLLLESYIHWYSIISPRTSDSIHADRYIDFFRAIKHLKKNSFVPHFLEKFYMNGKILLS